MPVNPDTDVIYQEAVDLQGRVEEHEARRLEFGRLQRDITLELLSNGFLPDAAPEVRIEAIHLRANQIAHERRPELVEFLDTEGAAILALKMRNEGIIAAGWAENFAYTSQTRRIASQFEPKGEIEK